MNECPTRRSKYGGERAPPLGNDNLNVNPCAGYCYLTKATRGGGQGGCRQFKLRSWEEIHLSWIRIRSIPLYTVYL